ncbi:MAG TPA: DUF4157 domain-containing protein [Chitinophagaceae bacterium]
MSYRSRLYNHRNAMSPEIKTEKPFFSKKQADKNSSKGAFFQAKLSVNEPGDSYEQEADAMAKAVVNKSAKTPLEKTKISNIQRLATTPEEEKVSTNDQRMERDKEKTFQVQKKTMGDETHKDEDKMKKDAAIQAKPESNSSTASPRVSANIKNAAGKGKKLPAKTLKEMNSSFGANFNNVNIHTDNESVEMTKELQAQAFTHRQDIYFNSGKYNPDSTEGKSLLAHELTHVVQQNNEEVQQDTIQRDLAASLPTTQGVFEIGMNTKNATAASPMAGLDGSISFMPTTTAPYSNEIKLIQVIKVRDTAGNDVDISSMPPGRGPSLRTKDNPVTGAEGGFATDVLHQDFTVAGPTNVADPGSQKPLAYEGGIPVFGFKRSNDLKDIKAAEIADTPGSTSDLNFQFETVAKGQDTNTVYGSLHWGFGTRSGKVINESMQPENAQSATFDAAVELHRNFYVHEPVTFYFESDSDIVSASENAKIDDFLGYLKRFPDVRLSLKGFADNKGNAKHNLDLSLKRAQNVQAALTGKGIKASSINDIIIGHGSTEQFTSGDLAPNAGQSQNLEANRKGNRRVVLTFEHTVSFPGP